MRRVVLVSHGGIGDAVHVIPSIKAIRNHFGLDTELVYLAYISDSPQTKPHLTLADEIVLPLGLVDKFVCRRFSDRFLRWLTKYWFVLTVVYLALDPRLNEVFFLFPDLPGSRRLRFLKFACRLSRKFRLPRPTLESRGTFEGKPFVWVLLESFSRVLPRSTINSAHYLPFVTPPDHAFEEVNQWLLANRNRPERSLLAVCPGTSNPSNQWPVERFVELLSRLRAMSQFEIVLVGGANDRLMCDDIVRQCPGVLNAAAQLSILGSAALFVRSKLMVGLDTGTTHLASACGVSYVALYGQRGAGNQFYPPLSNGVVLQETVQCRGCSLLVCNKEGHPCMAGISVDAVLNAIHLVAGQNRSHMHESYAPDCEGQIDVVNEAC